MMRLAVNQKWPILLHGPSGAGKSALILQLAEASSKQGMLMSFSLYYFWIVYLRFAF